MTRNCNTKDVRASMSDALLMTAMVTFTPVMLCAMLLASAI